MKVENMAITGKETITDRDHPYSSLVEFYRAFNNRDIHLMAANWIDNDEASMSNPIGGLKRGWHEIECVYNRIFSGPAQVYVEYYDYTIHHTDNMFCAAGRERGYFILGETKINLDIRTSRIYRCINSHWKQIHHHGSIDKPDLLYQYQQAVAGQHKD